MRVPETIVVSHIGTFAGRGAVVKLPVLPLARMLAASVARHVFVLLVVVVVVLNHFAENFEW